MLYALITCILGQAMGMILFLDRMLTRHSRQVADLCQRLQAPETAVAQHVIGPSVPVSHLPFDDDAAWFKYQQVPVTDGDLG